MTTTVESLLKNKRKIQLTTTPGASAGEAARLMSENDLGALMVVQDGKVAGIVSERDILRKVVLTGRPLDSTPVREVMTPKVLYVRPEQTVDECMALMTEKHVRHLPVIRDGRLEDVISIRDVVRAALADKQFIIERLERYITG